MHRRPCGIGALRLRDNLPAMTETKPCQVKSTWPVGEKVDHRAKLIYFAGSKTALNGL